MRRLSLDSSAMCGSKPAPAAAVLSSSRSRAPSRKLMNGSCGELGEPQLRPARERVAEREHDDELLGHERAQLEAAVLDALGHRQEREVDLVLAQHRGELLAGLLAHDELDGRMAVVERGEQQREVHRAHRVQRADRQAPRLHAGERLQLGVRGVELGECPARAGDEQLAGLRHRDAPRRALDERDAELRLEAADLLRQRRLRDVLAGGRAREVALVRDGDEVAQLAQIHAFSL